MLFAGLGIKQTIKAEAKDGDEVQRMTLKVAQFVAPAITALVDRCESRRGVSKADSPNLN